MDPDASHPRLSRLALASLILGILSVLCLSVFAGIPAIICGHMARSRIRRSGDALRGSTQAIIGLILGYLSIVTAIVVFPLLVSLGKPVLEVYDQAERSQDLMIQARQLHSAVQAAALDGFSSNRVGLGWPADSGITSRQQLGSILVSGQYLAAEDLQHMVLENFQIGNVSQSDSPNTIFLLARSPNGETILILKDGSGEIFASPEEAREAGVLPPRTPEFLE